MTPEEFIAMVERDYIIGDALHRALLAMGLIDGATVYIEGRAWHVNFTHEMAKLQNALDQLARDSCEPQRRPRRGRNLPS